MKSNFLNKINQWFDSKWGGSLHLPDGWFGRPYDNQHTLTFANEKDGDITLILDENLILCFQGIKGVICEGDRLILGPFDTLRFEWTPYGKGGGEPQVKKYKSGTVEFVATSTI